MKIMIFPCYHVKVGVPYERISLAKNPTTERGMQIMDVALVMLI